MKTIMRMLGGGLWAPLAAVIFLVVAKTFSPWMPQWMQATAVVVWFGLSLFGILWVWLIAPRIQQRSR